MAVEKTIKLFGVAGSGKTTRCLELIKEFLREYRLEEITFTTYTKAGIRSIKEKLEHENIFLPDQNFFDTMHALSWKLSGFSYNVLTDKKFADFCKENDIDFSEEEETDEKSIGAYIKEFYDYIQDKTAKKTSDFDQNELLGFLNEKYTEDKNMTVFKKRGILSGLDRFIEWKQEKNLYTFSDSLIFVLDNKIDITTPILIVDEAQDLFYAQIQIVKMWVGQFNRKIFVLAGDDDQTVHEWNGSDPSFLITTTSNEKIILEQTYRCPPNLCIFLNLILDKIEYREPKKIWSNKPNGEMDWLHYPSIFELEGLVKPNVTTFFLFRTNKLKKIVADKLFDETDSPFSFIGGTSRFSLGYCLLNNALAKLNEEKPILAEEAEEIVKRYRTEELKRGVKTNFSKTNKSLTIEYDKFLSDVLNIGLKRFDTKFKPKEYILQRIDFMQNPKNTEEIRKNEVYRQKLAASQNVINFKTITSKNKERKTAILPLQLGTFHACKGLQAENVFVFLGTSKFFSKMNDSEFRCLYVACSRSTQKMALVSTNFSDEETWLEDEVKIIWKEFKHVSRLSQKTPKTNTYT